MASHNNTGMEGEALAVNWFKEKGYEILHRNWRYSYFEIDIIAVKDGRLHIVEVKCRHATPFGNPEDSVTKKKFKRLQRAANEYLFQNPNYRWIQYDVLAITLYKDREAKFMLLQDVFL